MRATVVTIRTTIEPGRRVQQHSIVIAGNVARSTSEHDVWRLFDSEASTVTVVDEIEKTVRTEPLSSFVTSRRNATATAPPPYIPRLAVARNGERRTFLGVTAERVTLTAGEYRRDLWVGRHPAIPPSLFAMMHLTETPTSPLASMMRRADEAIAALKGFPLVDHAEVPLGDVKIVVDHTVVSIVERDVPAGLVQVPRGFTAVGSAQP